MKMGIGKHDFCTDLDIKFNPSKENLILKLTSTQGGRALANLYSSGHFMQSLAKPFFSKLAVDVAKQVFYSVLDI